MSTGFDTSNLIQNVRVSAVNAFGQPDWWLRYCDPCNNTSINSSQANAVAECRAAWDSGGPMIGCISTPPGSLTGTAAGQADAQTFAGSIRYIVNHVSTLFFPDSDQVYVWLDVEPGVPLGANYWDAWANYLIGAEYGSLTPLYPAVYTKPCDHRFDDENRSVCQNADAGNCYGVWSYEPQRCSGTLQDPPDWAPQSCHGCNYSNNTVPTILWQFGIQDNCGWSPNVDLDSDSPDIIYGHYMLVIGSRP
jgi:hypothetical protein